MKKLILIALMGVSLSLAGPLSTASYPVRHPLKVTKAVKTGVQYTFKGAFAVVKALIW